MDERGNILTPHVTFRSVAGAGGAMDFLRAPCAGYPEHTHAEHHVAIPISHVPMRAEWRASTGRQRRQSLGGDDICVVPRERPHTIVWEGMAEFLFLYLTPAQLTFAAHDLVTGEPGEITEWHGVSDPFLRQMGAVIRAEFGSEITPPPLYIESAMHVLAVHLLRRYAAQSKPLRASCAALSPRALQTVREYIAADLAADLSLGAMAAVCHLSPYHFARAFKRTTGQTPHAYVTAERVAHAQRLLRETDHPIGTIAVRAGFGSQSHMAAQFRRRVHVTPRRYRAETT